MVVAIDGRVAGLIAVADPIKTSAGDVIAALRAEGLRIVMLTGDGRGTPQAVARPLLSFLFNGVGVPIAAGVLYPVAGILLSPMFAGAAMALSSFTVVVNALRLNVIQLAGSAR